MKNFILALLALITFTATAQTKIDATKLLKAGANSTFMFTNASGAVVWGNAATLFTAGTGMSISGNTFTNTAPDQTVVLTGGTGMTVTGTYPNFTLTPADGSATNEIQTISAGGSTSPTIDLSNSGGAITFVGAGGLGLSRSGNTITLTQGSTSLPTVDHQTYREVLASSGTTVTVTGFTPTVATTEVYLDGVLMENGAGNDYTLSGSVYTFLSTLNAGQKVVVKKLRVQ